MNNKDLEIRENQKNENTNFIHYNFYIDGLRSYKDEKISMLWVDEMNGNGFRKTECILKSIDILKAGDLKRGTLRKLLLTCPPPPPKFLNDFYYLKNYELTIKEIEKQITNLELSFDSEPYQDEVEYNYNIQFEHYRSQIAAINNLIELTKDFRLEILKVIPDLEIEFNRLLIESKPKIDNTIIAIKAMPTWANKSEMETIWNELVSLELVDAKDKNNFLTAFGFGDGSLPFEKFSLGTSATNLRVLLTLMIDGTSKIPSVENRKIANDLFTIQLNKTTKPNEDDMNRWSGKLQQTDRLRKSTTQYEDDFEPTIE